jgi:hypothetical protein
MRYLIAGIVGALLFVAIVGGTGTNSAELAAERTAQVQAQQAAQVERTAIMESAHTERTAINADLLRWQMAQEAQTQRLIVMLLGVIVAGMAMTVVTVATLRYIERNAQRQAAQVRRPAQLDTLAAMLPDHRAEYDDTLAAWILVDAHGRYYTIEDAQRITARMIAQR